MIGDWYERGKSFRFKKISKMGRRVFWMDWYRGATVFR